MREGSYCKFDDITACFTCPYDDCIASGRDINRQNAVSMKLERKKRNEKIIKMWNEGYSVEHISAVTSLKCESVSSILRIAKKNGVEVK